MPVREEKLRAAVYARVSALSTADADTAKDSVPQQVRQGKAAVARMGWTLVEVFEDKGISAWDGGPGGHGKPKERPGWTALMEAARRRDVDVVVMRHVDRLLRNPQARADLRGVGLKVADHSGNVLDDFALGILAEVATKESDVRSDRQRAAELRRVEAGLPPRGGHRHFGYARSHEVIEQEAAVIREMADRWLAGETLYALARDLNGRGIPTTRGNEWTYRSLKKMVQSPRLAGIRVHNGEQARGGWTPIISEVLHLQLINADAKHRTGRAPGHYLLTGLLVCGREGCGEKLNGKVHRAGSRRYQCYGCQRNGIGAEPVEQYLWNEALGRVWHADRHAGERISARQEAVVAELRDVRERAQELDDFYWQGAADERLPKDVYVRQSNGLRQRIEDLEAEARDLEERREQEEGFWSSLLGMTDHYESATDEAKRQILRRAVTSVTLMPAAGGKGGVVDLGRLQIAWAVPRQA